MNIRRWLMAAAMAWATAAAYAENETTREHWTDPDTLQPVARLSDLLVTAHRADLQAKEILDETFLVRESQSRTVEGFLGDLAGIDLNRQSYAGSESQRLSIRGFDETRSLVLLDGRSLHGAGVYGGYSVDWASLSLEGVESVEVIRGAAPVKYGNTLGGVVNIVSRQAKDETQATAGVSAGSLNTWDAQAGLSASAAPATYTVSAGRFETDGYLRNAWVKRHALCANLGIPLLAEAIVSVGVRYTENEVGMIVYNMPDAWNYDSGKPDALDAALGGPYVPFLQSHTGPMDWGDGSYWKDNRLNADIALSGKTENLDVAMRAYVMNEERQEYFYAADNPRHLILRRDSEPEKNNWGWRMDFRSDVGPSHSHALEYGAEGQYLGYGGMTVKTADPAYFRQMPTDSPGKTKPITTFHGIYAADSWRVNERVRVQAGARADHFRADGPEAHAVTVEETPVSPRLACLFEPWAGGRAAARVGQAYRYPNNPEYYWWYSGYQPPDRRDLTSEKANQYELEISQDLDKHLRVLARGYYYQVQDYIRTIFGYWPSRVVYNIDEVEFMGMEWEVSCDPSPELRFFVNFTCQGTKKHGDVLDRSVELSDELVELPKNKANAGIVYCRKKGWGAELVAGYVDKRQAVRGNPASPGGSYLADMDAYVNVKARVHYPLYRDDVGREVRVELAGENLLGQDIVEEYGYPMPGATAMAGVRAAF